MTKINRTFKAKRRSNLPDTASVVKVGEGRGFVIAHRVKVPLAIRKMSKIPGLKPATFCEYPIVVTAAHCLPQLPPAHASSYLEEKTYMRILGTLSDEEITISAECLFVDPVADIAVLGCPDDQEFVDEAEKYEAFIEGIQPVGINTAQSGSGWVLSLAGQWICTTLIVSRGLQRVGLSIDAAEEGMSGSPILNSFGGAVGVVVIGSETVGHDENRTNERAWGQPILRRDLPGRLLI